MTRSALEHLKVRLNELKVRQHEKANFTLLLCSKGRYSKLSILTPLNLMYNDWIKVKYPTYLIVSLSKQEIETLKKLFEKFFEVSKIMRI
ncbi:MAG: hypothetical protein NDF54_10465 [archaeon GB-1867-035]|nr:hypothetical protein [Candidatus Culexmicrobium profundum]